MKALLSIKYSERMMARQSPILGLVLSPPTPKVLHITGPGVKSLIHSTIMAMITTSAHS